MKASGPVSDFVKAGIPARDWFNHYVVVLAKQYSDTFLCLSRRDMPSPVAGLSTFRQMNLYATDVDGLPEALFSDKRINWHQQQLGLKGHVASAGMYLHNRDDAFVLWLQSDLCQQLYRHAELREQCRTQVDSRFGHWHQVLLNAILDFCLDRNMKTLYVPTGDSVLRLTRKRIWPQLFRRVYDDVFRRLDCGRCIVGGVEYWRTPILENLSRIAPLRNHDPMAIAPPSGVCIFHDIEENVDTEVAKADCKRWLLEMLGIERAASVPVTCSVLGSLFAEKLPDLAAHDVRSLAFHSYDHDVDGSPQLPRVRKVDLQVRGYRPPRSVITPELSDRELSFHNFEWLLSSAASLQSSHVFLVNGLVKIPVHLDDYALHSGRLTLSQWFDALSGLLDQLPLVVVGLHDCYAGHWIGSYGKLLERLRDAGRFWTCDQIADTVFLASDAPQEPGRARN